MLISFAPTARESSFEWMGCFVLCSEARVKVIAGLIVAPLLPNLYGSTKLTLACKGVILLRLNRSSYVMIN